MSYATDCGMCGAPVEVEVTFTQHSGYVAGDVHRSCDCPLDHGDLMTDAEQEADDAARDYYRERAMARGGF